MKNFKRYFGLSHSLIHSYKLIKKPNRSSTLAWIFILIGIMFLGFILLIDRRGSKKDSPVQLIDPIYSEEIESQLHRQLIFLNNQSTLTVLTPATVKKRLMKSSSHTIKPVTIKLATHKKIKPGRFSASALLYSRSNRHSSALLRLSEHPTQTHQLMAGTVIHAVLESAINSDLPGPVRALVSEPAYAFHGSTILIPIGTRLLGEYGPLRSAVQNRIGVRWRRMILPNGRSVSFDFPLTDPLGRIGISADRIERHFWPRFGSAGLYSVLSGAAGMKDGAQANTLTAGQRYADKISDSFSQTAQSLLEKNINLVPTLFLDPGAEVIVFVRRDMMF